MQGGGGRSFWCNGGCLRLRTAEHSDVLDAETAICSLLQLDLAIPTSLDFLFCLLQRLRWPRLFAVHRGLHTQAVMLAQLLCELSLLSPPLAHCPRASLVASCALCLSLACLRCGVWRDGSPGPSASPEQYWTASMAQATGYGRHDLRELMGHLRSIHEEAAAELASDPIGAHANDHWGGGFSGKFGVLRHKYSQPRFLGVLKVPPFTPHSGGSLYSPIAQHVVRAPTSSPRGAAASRPPLPSGPSNRCEAARVRSRSHVGRAQRSPPCVRTSPTPHYPYSLSIYIFSAASCARRRARGGHRVV